jgi:drug/metabolite transporter (DMT)-like permease
MGGFSNNPDEGGNFRGILLLAAGAFLISFSAVFVKLAQVPSTTSGFYRVLLGGLMLLALVLIKGQRIWRGTRSFWLAVLCGLLFALDLGFWHVSILLVGPGLSTILTNFQVFGLAAVGVFFLGERLGLRRLLSMPLAMAGLALLVGVHKGAVSSDHLSGVWAGLIAACCYTAYTLSLRKLQGLQGPGAVMANLAMVSLVCAAFLGVAALVQGQDLTITRGMDWFWLSAYGLVGQVLGWVLISRGLPLTSASQVGLILLLQPTLAFIWDLTLFGRPTNGLEYLGAVMALSAIYMGSAPSRKKPA